MKKIALIFLLVTGAFTQSNAQVDTLIPFKVDPALTLAFPKEYTTDKGDFRAIFEGKSNGIIYNLFVTEEYAYKLIKNNIELDSLYELVLFNTQQVYAGETVDYKSYTYNFGSLRGKYMSVESTNASNPYVAEYYLMCVKGRLYVMSVTYLKNYTEQQLKQAKNFLSTIHFDEQLTWQDQMNRL